MENINGSYGAAYNNIQTYVMFDTETTGLPSPGNRPQITELCFIALTRDELLTKHRTPRVLNKLLLCFNPLKRISLHVSSITGLHNDALEIMEPFRKQASLLCTFLRNLPHPVCLIAHNGNWFDFPLLVKHLRLSNEEIPEGVYCADSLEAFRTFDGLPPVPDHMLQKKAEAARLAAAMSPVPLEDENCKKRTQVLCESSVNGGNKILVNGQDKNIHHKERRETKSDELSSSDVRCKQPKLSTKHIEIWNMNEQTPQQSPNRDAKPGPNHIPSNLNGDVSEKDSTAKRRLFGDKTDNINGFSDASGGVMTAPVCENGSKAKKQLFEDKADKVNGYFDASDDDMVGLLCEIESKAKQQLLEVKADEANDFSEVLARPVCLSSGKDVGYDNGESTNPLDSGEALPLQATSEEHYDGNCQSNACNEPAGGPSVVSFSHNTKKAGKSKSSPSNAGQIMNGPHVFELDSSETSPLKATSEGHCDKNCSQTYTCNESSGGGSVVPSSHKKEANQPSPSSASQAMKVSYALSSVYTRLFGHEFMAAHTAEGDCYALLEIVYNYKCVFTSWCDKNAVPLSSIAPMQ